MDSSQIIGLEEGWNNEIKAIALDPLEQILEEGLTKKKLFSHSDYSKVYTTCYNMCTQKSPFNWSEQLYERHGVTIANYLLHKVLPSLKTKHDEFLLHEFVKRSDNHSIMNKWCSKFFTYLDRYHVKYQQLPTLSDSGMKKYKTIVFDNVKKDVTTSILRMIHDEREGQVVDRDLIKKCIAVYVTMGMTQLDVYENDFEKLFLENTKEYYGKKADHWITTETTPAYLIRMEKLLDDERQRVINYLHAHTETELLFALEKELLEKRCVELLEKEHSGCRVMLQQDMYEDLGRLFKLFQRIQNGLEPTAEIFKQHLLACGTEIMEQRQNRLNSAATAAEGKSKEGGEGSSKPAAPAKKESSGAGGGGGGDEEGGGKESNDDPQYIKDLLALHEKYYKMVTEQFHSNALFHKALKDAFVDIVNKDIGKFKTADLIATFCDRLLKSGSSEKLNDNEIEEFFEKCVTLFSYLTDKDVFAEIYRHLLAKRLLQQRSASDDMEKIMIGKLKMRCGAQFTAKMEGMINDLAIGAEQSSSFEAFCRENPDKTGIGKVEFTVQVLTTGHWPQYKPLNEMNLPSIMQRCTQVFKEYYDVKTQHRKLTWTHSLGNASIKGNFQNLKKAYDLQVTTVQAIVMLCFNQDSLGGSVSNGIVTFSHLLETLNMPEDVLKKVLHSLSCGKFKIVKKVNEDGSVSTGNAIRATDAFIFNDAFTCPMRKIRIPMALLDDSSGAKRVEEDRSHAIEACIVRIMKARKTLAHQQLIAEVLAQLAFFKPDPKLIKKRIENLIDREYLERDPDNANVYRYLA